MRESTHTYDSAYPAVTDVFSRPHDNLVLVYGNSNRDTYTALAFQVTRTVRRVERVFDALTINAGNSEGFGWFGENGFSSNTSNPGDEVFSIQSERASALVEYGFAVPQDGVYVGIETGDGTLVDGLMEGDERGRGLGPEDLDTRAGVLSDYTRIDSPTSTTDDAIPTTALSEAHNQGLVRIDSKQDGSNRFFFGFKNESGASVTIDVIGLGLAYEVRPVMDEKKARAMVAGEEYNRRILNYGAMDNQNPNLPREWFDARVDIGPGELSP